jgi:D-alanyl-lipoteichoic acid acyltransferase DltB (MBOAT superfamily)
MLFHTWTFLIFFAVFYPAYLVLRRTDKWLPWLLLASYVFYGWWNPWYLILVVYSTVLDYVVVILMDGSGRRKLWLGVSIINNLFLLSFFKYAGFLTENANALLSACNAPFRMEPPDVLLPVGISFYTFQSMSYTIDFYRGLIERERSFIRFASFVTLFPQLVAGPIERASRLLPQLQQPPRIRLNDVTDGVSLFVVGLFKKIALANYLSLYVDRIYTAPELYEAPALALATFAFAWQIFFDFSGYTDMARGIGRVLGFRFMLNFNNPYLATGLADFWGRWHISLSTWFRDYVYIPLGGNRRWMWRNLFLTFFVSGIWHGAAWTFVIWGALHGLAACLARPIENSAWYRDRIPRLAKQLAIFAFVCLTWVFFRAESVADALTILTRTARWKWEDPQFPLLALGLIVAVWLYQQLYESAYRPVVDTAAARIALVVGMLLYICLIPGTPDKPFIYFQF